MEVQYTHKMSKQNRESITSNKQQLLMLAIVHSKCNNVYDRVRYKYRANLAGIEVTSLNLGGLS